MSKRCLIKLPKPHRLIVFAGILLSIACSPRATEYPVLAGGSLLLSDLYDKVVFINYWAVWCKPCRVEIPELNAFAKKHAEDVRVLSVNFDGVVGSELAEQVRAVGIEFDTLLLDPRPALGAPPGVALPETIVLDRNGKLLRVLVGPQNQESLQNVLLGVPVKP
jgi:thiol-disulfide isomerase/thioredoxin